MVFLYAETMQTRDYHMECPDTLNRIEDQFFSCQHSMIFLSSDVSWASKSNIDRNKTENAN